MAIAQLILEYIQTLVWPVAVLVVLFLFRHQFVGLIHRMSHARLPGGTELDFQVEQVTERAKHELDKQLTAEVMARENSAILDRIRGDPGLGMAQLRIELEKALRSLYQLKRSTSTGKATLPSLGRLVSELESGGDLPQYIATYLRDIIPLANRAIHGESVSTQAAESLGQIGVKLLEELRRLYREKALEPLRRWEISQEDRSKLQEARYKVITVIPYVEKPLANERELNQEQLYLFLEGYEEFAEFIVGIEPITAIVPKPGSPKLL